MGCSFPPGEGRGDYCWAHRGWRGVGVPGGPGPQTTGTPGCGHAAGLSEAPEEPARFKGWEKGNVPLDAAQFHSL